MGNPYIPDLNKRLSLLATPFIMVGGATLSDGSTLYCLTGPMGTVVTRKELREILDCVQPFYDKLSDEELEQHNLEQLEPRPSSHPSNNRPAPQPPQPKPGFVYLLRGNDQHKIGRTKHVDDRMKQISQKLPFEIELVHAIETDDTETLEAQLHDRFADRRLKGEWFDLSEQDVKIIQGM